VAVMKRGSGLDQHITRRDFVNGVAGDDRIAFGHSDLDGLQHWGGAADEGRRAYRQVKDAMLSS